MTPLLLFIAPTAGWPVWLPRLLVFHTMMDRTMQQRLNILQFVYLLSVLISDVFLPPDLSLFLNPSPLRRPSVSTRREWQLAVGEPIRGRAGRPSLPLLSDLAEHATALHRFGAASRGQRGKVS